MATVSINIFTLDYAQHPSQIRSAVSSSISYARNLNDGFQTLSTNTESSGNDIEGFLYVPDIGNSSACVNGYIPSNVTRKAVLPSSDYALLAFAPWISTNCTLAYLNAANIDNVNGFIFYLINQLNTSDYGVASPPPPTDSAWNIGDNNAWKTKYGFPVYAINPNTGNTIMTELSLYSGNISSAPYGAQLSAQYSSTDNVRLYCDVGISTSNSLPNLWVFLVIVVGILVTFLIVTSISMRVLQRRRRGQLRAMIVAGQIDLETLGIKRLRVPEGILAKIPIIVYVAPDSDAKPSSQNEAPSSAKTLLFYQPSCPICLDDFESGKTEVRQLPCMHVYHPACVDPLLSEYSSLCAICKRSVLPPGYCPEITNLMVRRERMLRRLGGTIPPSETRVDISDQTTATESPRSRWPSTVLQSFRFSRGNIAAQPSRTTGTESGTELAEITQRFPPRRRPSNISRADWARQRANVLVGQSRTIEDEEQQQERARPGWRKALGTMFPTSR